MTVTASPSGAVRSRLCAAVVGCGALANSAHLPNLAHSERFVLQVACDRSATAAEAAARRWQAQRSETDWRAVVAADVVD